MTYTPSTEIAQIGIRLMDHAYMAWLGAESECERALRAWVDGPPRNRAAMYLSYRAALDREEAAARDLQRLSELAARSCQVSDCRLSQIPYRTENDLHSRT
jgi:hypothetical protein